MSSHKTSDFLSIVGNKIPSGQVPSRHFTGTMGVACGPGVAFVTLGKSQYNRNTNRACKTTTHLTPFKPIMSIKTYRAKVGGFSTKSSFSAVHIRTRPRSG
ncbi:hypothetical protein ACN42_g1018 [Penicillium freii]|uniref:Uncharacterized protein n=1 Tax=Penicillium freii TaxID=48697 RepID=A0A117NRV1_PENFR|nr:hypothetical protein ACN42_g1018 [Penicillium freii]